MKWSLVLLLAGAAACKKQESNPAPITKAPPPGVSTTSTTTQVAAPFDLKTPPADATKTASGLVYKVITPGAPDAPTPKRNDTVMIKYTGWRQLSGETFFNNMKEEAPMPLNLAVTAKGFTEGLQLVKKGEKAMLWLPPDIGLKNMPAGKAGETLVYLVEVVDIQPAPPVPPDLASPPADAKATRSGAKYLSVKPGTGKDKPRVFDDVTFSMTAWDAEGRMFDTTEMKKKPPAKVQPFRQAAPLEEVLTSMVAGERVRFWIDSSKMVTPSAPQTSMPLGQHVYEIELVQIDKAPGTPPPTPADVAKPPGDAKKTEKGTFYKVLVAGKGGPKPKPTDTVKVHYTGWTTDGRMFDSSMVRNEPSTFGLGSVIKGWTDGIPLMSVGDKYRFWIPFEMAYKDNPSRPQGMLVFEVELLEIKESAAPPPGHNPHGGPPPGAPDPHGH